MLEELTIQNKLNKNIPLIIDTLDSNCCKWLPLRRSNQSTRGVQRPWCQRLDGEQSGEAKELAGKVNEYGFDVSTTSGSLVIIKG